MRSRRAPPRCGRRRCRRQHAEGAEKRKSEPEPIRHSLRHGSRRRLRRPCVALHAGSSSPVWWRLPPPIRSITLPPTPGSGRAAGSTGCSTSGPTSCSSNGNRPTPRGRGSSRSRGSPCARRSRRCSGGWRSTRAARPSICRPCGGGSSGSSAWPGAGSISGWPGGSTPVWGGGRSRRSSRPFRGSRTRRGRRRSRSGGPARAASASRGGSSSPGWRSRRCGRSGSRSTVLPATPRSRAASMSWCGGA